MITYLPEIWAAVGWIYVIYNIFRMYFCSEPGRDNFYLFWMGFWIFMPKLLNEKGKRIRKKLFIVFPIWIVGSIVIDILIK